MALPQLLSIICHGLERYLQRNEFCAKQGLKAYNTVVRPQLEYASPIWDQYTKGKILQIEKGQRRAARWTINDFETRSSVTGMLDNLGWRTLEQRRADARLSIFYKIGYGLVAIAMPVYIQPNLRVSRNCHSVTFRQVQTSRNLYKVSFFRWA